MTRARPYAVLLAGATASGKSALAMRLAQDLHGELVGADALQIYKELPILTASPDAAQRARVPHHLYNTQSGLQQYTLGKWQQHAWAHIQDICARGRLPIVVGGTGLYFKSLTAGLAQVPPVPSGMVRTLRARLRKDGAQSLWNELKQYDAPAAGRIAANDTQRVLRALGVYHATKRPLSAWQAETQPLPLRWCGYLLRPDKADLDTRIAARLDAQLKAGVLEEVAVFLKRNVPADAPIMQALGATALQAHLRSDISLADAKAAIIMETRQYAKRQRTWFRKYMADWKIFDTQQYTRNIEKIRSFIAEN